MPANITAPTTEKTVESLLKLIQELGEELGKWTINFFENLLGSSLPSDLEASVGILLILTLFLAGAEFSKKDTLVSGLRGLVSARFENIDGGSEDWVTSWRGTSLSEKDIEQSIEISSSI
ncbi:hypothetical protein AKJ36_00230 [candidate division MSBL1 archaeon SCGC-AAA259I07]|uniref:Uncharacterized protein n=1 Tax=candidate division MSBL1 archaeon SCGC-AAA259I07 TaxID=1698266 RepID=A0A133UN62_9EURY|nr:hypothetical protein AKJ36_00230 [candidate division MSBL1 archaeon SCGC-AAA259I07]